MTRFAFLVPLFLLPPTLSASPTVKFETLLKEMIDLRTLTKFPSPSYRLIQFSSYDRRSKRPYTPGWFANSDGFGREPIPGFVRTLKEPGPDGVGSYIMAEVKGPGVVVRTWTAMITGRIRLFLDDLEKPFYEGPAQEFLLDTFKALTGEELSPNGFKQRNSCYFPIPFSKRCVIQWTGNVKNIHFYQIEVRKYAPVTQVKTLTRKDLKLQKQLIKEVSKALLNPGFTHAPKGEQFGFHIRLEPNQRKEVLQTDKGPACISLLQIAQQSPDPELTLREVALRISFDGSPNPQVLAPLGDFFGSFPGPCPYVSFPMEVEPTGRMSCRFIMPFKKSCRLEFENFSASALDLVGNAWISPYQWDEKRSMHFFASYKVDNNIKARHHGEVLDLPFLCAIGKGVYVGTSVSIMNPTEVPTEAGGWWGEGDEKIWVDQKDSPCIFGTGSEDYFNYAWSSPDHFSFGYAAQVFVTGPGNRGYVSNLRWHIADPIPFNSCIFFFMELFPHLPVDGLSYGRISYFYAFPLTRDDRPPLKPSLFNFPKLPPYLPRAAGACRNALFFQAEGLKVLRCGGKLKIVKDRVFAGLYALKWEPLNKNDSLELLLPVEKAGTYSLGFTFAHVAESNHVQITLNGKSIRLNAKPQNLHSPYKLVLRNCVGDRKFKLKEGSFSIHVRSVDGSGRPVAAPVIIDYVWLIRR